MRQRDKYGTESPDFPHGAGESLCGLYYRPQSGNGDGMRR